MTTSGLSQTHPQPHNMHKDPEGPLSCECECSACWRGGFDGYCLCLACQDEFHDHTRRTGASSPTARKSDSEASS